MGGGGVLFLVAVWFGRFSKEAMDMETTIDEFRTYFQKVNDKHVREAGVPGDLYAAYEMA